MAVKISRIGDKNPNDCKFEWCKKKKNRLIVIDFSSFEEKSNEVND